MHKRQVPVELAEPALAMGEFPKLVPAFSIRGNFGLSRRPILEHS
jgi:hypothetical protein